MIPETPAGAVSQPRPAPAVPTPSKHLSAQLNPSEGAWVRVFPLPAGGPQWLRAMWFRVLVQSRLDRREGA